MSPVREKFIKAIEALPYDIDEEVKKRETLDILRDVTQKYVELYGTDDLNENDKECIEGLIVYDKSLKRKDCDQNEN